MSNQALSGIKVIELGDLVSAAYCTKMMADLGAEVIKIEEPRIGDEARQYGPFPDDLPHPERSGLFLYLNSNKLGITLNLKTTTGKRILNQILKNSDILVENNAPSVMKEMGLDYPTLKETHPQLIMTSITPFGQTGPYKDFKAYDLNIQAAGGQSFGLGDPNRVPLSFPLLQASFQAGVNGAAATLVALFSREITNVGQHVDISATQIFASLHRGITIPPYYVSGNIAQRMGHHGAAGLWPWGVLPCKDGFMNMMSMEFKDWQKFAEAIGNPEWAITDPDTGERYENSMQLYMHMDELEAHLIPWLLERTKKEIWDFCYARRIPYLPVFNFQEVVENPQLNSRQYFVEIEHPIAGTIKCPGAPVKMSKTPWKIDRSAPLLGEHNEEVYCNRFGFTKDQLTNMMNTGII